MSPLVNIAAQLESKIIRKTEQIQRWEKDDFDQDRDNHSHMALLENQIYLCLNSKVLSRETSMHFCCLSNFIFLGVVSNFICLDDNQMLC